MTPVDIALPGESKRPERPDRRGATARGGAEQSVIGAPVLPDVAFSQIAEVLAVGYLRGLAQRGEATRAFSAGRNPLISVDSRGQQSDELVTDKARGDGGAS